MLDILTAGFFSFSDIICEAGVIGSLPINMIRDTRNNSAGICIIGFWKNGPSWMTRFGEMFAATRAEFFISDSNHKSKLLAPNFEKVEKKILKRFSRGKKILKGAPRKSIDINAWEIMKDLLEVPSNGSSSIHYWIAEVFFRFIVIYASYIEIEF